MNLEEATEFKSRLDNIKDNSEELFKKEVLHHKYFTIHGKDHFHAIISILNDLVEGIEPNKELTKHEIFYLLVSVYLHDVGMLFSYPNDEDTAKTISTHEMPFTKEDVIRKEHHIRSGKYVIEHADILSLDQFESECVRLICEGHRRVNLESEDYDDRFIGNETIRVRFIAALLRFSDELDISYKRAPIKIFEILEEEMPDYSLLQWLKHYYTSGMEISNIIDTKRGRKTIVKIQIQYPDEQGSRDIEELIFEPIKRSHNNVEKIFLSNGLIIFLKPPKIIVNKNLIVIPEKIHKKFLNQKVSIEILKTKEDDGKLEERNITRIEQNEAVLLNLAEAAKEIGTPYEIIGATNASTGTSLCATSADNPSILYYELEERVGYESIILPIYPNLTIPYGELNYTTKSWGDFIAWGGNKYAIIERNATNWIIAEMLVDEHKKDSYLLRLGETLILPDGWGGYYSFRGRCRR